jgi:hypothetical protein
MHHGPADELVLLSPVQKQYRYFSTVYFQEDPGEELHLWLQPTNLCIKMQVAEPVTETVTKLLCDCVQVI